MLTAQKQKAKHDFHEHKTYIENMVLLENKYDESYEYIINHWDISKEWNLNENIWIKIGNHKFEGDEYDEALKMYKQLPLQIDMDIDRNIAYCYQKLNETQSALRHYYKYLEKHSSDKYCIHNIAVLEYYNKNYAAALQMYNKMEEAYIKQHYLYFNIAVCYHNMNEFEKALIYFDKSIELKSKSNINALISMAWIYNKKLKDYRKAIEIYHRLSDDIIDVKDLEFDIAWSHQQCHEYKDALKYYTLYLNKHESNCNTLHNIAWIYINNENDANAHKAKALLLKILTIDKHHFHANYTFGIFLRDIDLNYDLSLKCLRIAHDKQPNNVQIMIDIAKTHNCLGAIESAKSYYLAAIKLNENDCYVNIEYAHFCAIIGHYKLSHFYYKKVLNLIMNNDKNDELLHNINIVENYTNYAHVLHKLNRNNEAIAVLKRAHAINERDCNTLNNLGFYYYLIKNYNESQKYLQLCLEINPNHEFTNSTFANLLFDNKQFKNAAVYYQKALQLDSDVKHPQIGPQILYNYSLILYNEQQLNESIKYCLQIVNESQSLYEHYPHLHKVYYLLAKIYHQNGALKLALNWIKKALAIKTNNSAIKQQYQILYENISHHSYI